MILEMIQIVIIIVSTLMVLCTIVWLTGIVALYISWEEDNVSSNNDNKQR